MMQQEFEKLTKVKVTSEEYYEFLKDNGINIECKDGMFPFAFVKEIAAFRGNKIFWKREA